MTIVACLSPYFTGAACVSKTINVAVDPCKVTSTSRTGNLANKSYTSYVDNPSSFIFNIPTYTPTPNCGYTQ